MAHCQVDISVFPLKQVTGIIREGMGKLNTCIKTQVSCLHIFNFFKFCTVRGGPAQYNTCTCIFKPFIAGLHVYIILLYNSVFKIHSIFNIEEHVLQIDYRNVVNYIDFYCACMIMYKAFLL